MTAREQATLVVRSMADLARLEHPRAGLRALRVELPGMSEHERMRLQTTLARDYFACGCGAGRTALAAALAVAGVVLLLPSDAHLLVPLSAPVLWASCAVLVVGAVGLAQALSLARARRRLRATLRGLRHRDGVVPARDGEVSEVSVAG